MRAEIALGRVDPSPWLGRAWRCWHELLADRAYITEGIGGGLGPGRIFSRPLPIGWRTVMAWAAHNSVDHDDCADLLACVRAMDRAYLDHAGKLIEIDLRKSLK